MRRSFFSIKVEVCAKHGVFLDQFDSPYRARVWQRARHEAWWLARQITDLTYAEIGRQSGGRCGDTVRSGVEAYEARHQARRRREAAHG